MTTPDPHKDRLCGHCGSRGGRHLGECEVCHLSVCDRCGNTQHSKGERRVTHDACLHQADEGFSMIKFVK